MLRLENEVHHKIEQKKIIADFPVPQGSVKKAVPFLHEGHSLYDCDLKAKTIEAIADTKDFIFYEKGFVKTYLAKPGHIYVTSLNETNALKKVAKMMKNIFNTDVTETI